MRCGGGKTVLALHIASVLQKKTIVLVHKDFLMTQWRDRILQFLPDAKVGKIQSNVINTKDKDIVIGMLQSISMKALIKFLMTVSKTNSKPQEMRE